MFLFNAISFVSFNEQKKWGVKSQCPTNVCKTQNPEKEQKLFNFPLYSISPRHIKANSV
jgi:hypothetical protein